VIVSYGNPLDAMTEDDFFTGLSKPRNPLIMRIFQDLEYVERSGRGLPMIVEEYGREAFSFSRIAMKATFVFDKSMEEGERAAIGSEEKSKEKSKERILELIREDSQITTADLAKSTGLSIAGIEKNLRQLKESGKIRRVGPDKGGHWEIIR
jgi:predicted HTH transcriptional regulator